jgi:dihydrofolate synthase/folylpolyglutamate synthase
LSLDPAFPLITVGGTNGKGSVCAYLEAMLADAGYRVGLYTSPHLLRYNERVRIDERPATDAELCTALDVVEAARGDIPLTYFEQGTLAAMWLFQRAGLDAAILEVGLGGRLDAVNVWDADCAVVTSIDLDHQAFLGDTREAIGFEKAGIYRAVRPGICGDADPPNSLLGHAAQLGVDLLCAGRDMVIELATDNAWTLRVRDTAYPALPRPAMPGAHQLGNAACAVASLWALRERLPVPLKAMRVALGRARQPGRFQVIGQAPLRVVDVGHNPHAARALAGLLADLPPTGRVIAVLGMLADKDVEGVVSALKGRVARWHFAGLEAPRGLSAGDLAQRAAAAGVTGSMHSNPVAAWAAACGEADPADTILAFGSFLTAASVLSETTPHG